MKYLELQGTKLEPYPPPTIITDDDVSKTIDEVRDVLRTKREFHDRCQKAFVSWVQAYTKTLPADIFNIKKVDWIEIGNSWGLLQWPKMPELKRQFPEAVKDRTFGLDMPSNFDMNSLAYADKVREDKRQEMLQARARGERPNLPLKGGALADLKRRKEKAWSSQKEAKAVRDVRRERKEVRRKAERTGKMNEEELAEAKALEQLIAKVREKNANQEEVDDGEFEGFDD